MIWTKGTFFPLEKSFIFKILLSSYIYSKIKVQAVLA